MSSGKLRAFEQFCHNTIYLFVNQNVSKCSDNLIRDKTQGLSGEKKKRKKLLDTYNNEWHITTIQNYKAIIKNPTP